MDGILMDELKGQEGCRCQVTFASASCVCTMGRARCVRGDERESERAKITDRGARREWMRLPD